MSRNMRRMRRMRASESIRRLVAENSLRTDDLIAPIFVCDDPKEISSMPGISQVSPNKVADTVTQLDALGINAVILFGVPTTRDISLRFVTPIRTTMVVPSSARAFQFTFES